MESIEPRMAHSIDPKLSNVLVAVLADFTSFGRLLFALCESVHRFCFDQCPKKEEGEEETA